MVDALPIGGVLSIHVPSGPVGYDPVPLQAERASVTDLPAPTWGDWHASANPPPWLGQLNDWPPHRVAAGLGAAVVRAHQEELVAAAWEQAGQISEVERGLRQAQAALAAGQRLWRRCAAGLSSAPVAVLHLAGPAADRLAVAAASPRSLIGRISQTCLPPSVLWVAMRRLCRPSGALGRRVAALRDGSFSRSALVTQFVDGPPDHAPDRADESVRTPVGPAPPPANTPPHITAAVAAWQAAADAAAQAPDRPPPDLDALAGAVVSALDPAAVLPRRAAAQSSVQQTPAVLAEPGQPISRLRVGPRIAIPMITLLLEQGLDWLLPGVANLPADRVVLAVPDGALIESFLVGANHEMARELLWRRYPADRGASVFTRFWDRRTGPQSVRDIPDLTAWNGALGTHLDKQARLGVVVARGRLFREHPDLRVYAHRAVADIHGPVPEPAPDEATWARVTEQPVLRATFPPDLVLFGFAQDTATLRGNPPADPGWFLVLAEQPVGTRYGLAETGGSDGSDPITSWTSLAWSDLTLIGGHIDATAPPARVPAAGSQWSVRSDALATIVRRPSFRLFVHASRLIPEN